MCWMTLRHEPDALAAGIISTRVGESEAGGDSWGYAYVDESGELQIHKRVGRMPESIDVPVVDKALVHTRLTTTGRINHTNAHPMAIKDNDGETIAAVAHNGTWRDAPDHEFFSDTWHMARVMERFYQNGMSFRSAFEKTADKCGETMIALTRENVGYVYAGRFSIHKKGAKFQSSGYENRVNSGDIFRIGADGETEKIAENIGDVRGLLLTID